MPPVAAHTPIATWRSCGPNSGSISPSEVGSISAPPAACTTRAPISEADRRRQRAAGAGGDEHGQAEQERALAPERVGPAPGGTSSAANTIA